MRGPGSPPRGGQGPAAEQLAAADALDATAVEHASVAATRTLDNLKVARRRKHVALA